MASLDATVVNVALPQIARTYHVGVSSLQWVVTGYLLTLASLILLGGALGDRFGRRRVFAIGTAWFAAASVACGAAPNIHVLIAARLAQGVGGALLTPGSLAILQASFREADRAAAVGSWSGLSGIAGAIGPFVGGAVIQGPGWRWAFLLNVPLGALAIFAVYAAVPETKEAHLVRLDTGGAALGASALALATWSLTEAGRAGWTDPAVVTALVAGAVASAALAAYLRRSATPLVPRQLTGNRTFIVINAATVLLYGAIGLLFFLLSYELQVAAHWGAIRAGAALLPATVLMLLFSARSGALTQRIGPRLQLLAGPLIAAVGLGLLVRIGPGARWWTDVLPASVVLGVGLVTFVAPLTATVMAAADEDDVGVASATNNAVARSGSLLALAVVPVLAGLTHAHGPSAVTNSFRLGMIVAAALAAVSGPLMFFSLRKETPAAESDRKVYCPVDGPPIQRCPDSFYGWDGAGGAPSISKNSSSA
jgi:EmrB/QacA subfamily drug resistance transporter